MQITGFLENYSVIASIFPIKTITPRPHIPHLNDVPWSYSMVIFPAAFTFPAYESDSALNHMLTWYKVISVTGQSKFEV